MVTSVNEGKLARLINTLTQMWDDPQESNLLTQTIRDLDSRHGLSEKIAKEPGVEEIITQMAGRLANTGKKLSDFQGKRILDIACGSNSSKAPDAVHIKTPFRNITLGNPPKGYTALFEPWFCRILLELGADPVGVDFGDLDRETFTHYQVDLGKVGALDFLADHSFDGVQDSRLFGSPEFTAQFPEYQDRLQIAREIGRQEIRLLKPGGIVIHSDAQEWLEKIK